MNVPHLHASAKALGLLRILVFGIWFLKVTAVPLSSLAELPHAALNAPGVLQIVPAPAWPLLLQPSVLTGLQILTLVSLLGTAAGCWTRPLAIVSALLLVFRQGVFKGFTYVNHSDMALLYAALLLCFFPCGDALAFRRPKRRAVDRGVYGTALLSVVLMMCVNYCFIGVHRLVVGGLDLFTSERVMRMWMLRNAYWSRYPFAAWAQLVAASPVLCWVAQVGLGLVTLLEVAAPCAVLSRRYRAVFVAAMCLFHALSLILLNVLFWENVILLLVFFDVEKLVQE